MNEFKIGDQLLLRLVQAWQGLDVGHASSLITVISRYLKGEITEKTIEKFEGWNG